MPPIRPEKTMTTFGSVLRRARLAAGLTQRQLAERAGLSRAAIWRLEAERSRLRREQTLAQYGIDTILLPPDAPLSGACLFFGEGRRDACTT